MGAGHPVEEQQPVGVVDLVLHGDGLEGVGLDLTHSPVTGSWPRTVSRRARATSPVKSGTDMQPSRPRSCGSRSTHLGVAQNEQPVTGPGLGMTADVDAEHPRGTPTC